jgi:transcriptional regulator with XRE-family HTH domain
MRVPKATGAPNLPAQRMRVLIVQVMRDEKISQHEVARRIGLSQPQISQYLAGARNASPRMVDRVSRRVGIDESFFWDTTAGDEPDFRDYLKGRANPPAPPEFLEWERIIAPMLRPPLQPQERKQMAAILYHRGALEKYSRLLGDIRDGLSESDILAEAAATDAAQAESDALGVKRRGR